MCAICRSCEIPKGKTDIVPDVPRDNFLPGSTLIIQEAPMKQDRWRRAERYSRFQATCRFPVSNNMLTTGKEAGHTYTGSWKSSDNQDMPSWNWTVYGAAETQGVDQHPTSKTITSRRRAWVKENWFTGYSENTMFSAGIGGCQKTCWHPE